MYHESSRILGDVVRGRQQRQRRAGDGAFRPHDVAMMTVACGISMKFGLKSRLPAASKVELLQRPPRIPCPHVISVLLLLLTTPTTPLFPSTSSSSFHQPNTSTTLPQHFSTHHINSSQWPPFLVRTTSPHWRAPAIPSRAMCLLCSARNRITSSLPWQHHNHRLIIANVRFLQTSLPLSPPRSPSAPSTATPSPLLCSAPSSVTPTVRPRPPTPRRSSSSPRRLPPPPLPGVLPSSAPPSSLTVSVPSSTPLALSPTRAPPTSAA